MFVKCISQNLRHYLCDKSVVTFALLVCEDLTIQACYVPSLYL